MRKIFNGRDWREDKYKCEAQFDGRLITYTQKTCPA